MNTLAIKKVMFDILPLEGNSWDEFESYFTIKNVKKGELLLNIGEVCKHVYFINSGLVRCFYYSGSEQKEVTGQFFSDNRFLTDYYSFICQGPGNMGIEALEDSEIISIPRPGIYNMYDKYHSAERFGRLIAEQTFIEMHESIVGERTLSPEERYIKFIEERFSIFQRISLSMVASYLQITPEHLSRIRKKLASKPMTKSVGLHKVA